MACNSVPFRTFLLGRQELYAKWYEMTETRPKRGRPVSIDTAAALAAMVEQFRDKGFAAVSLDDLSEATGLSRPSLYRAFGDKLSMYLSATDAFATEVGETAIPALQAPGDLATAVANFFDEMLAIYFRDESVAPGCLVFGTAPCSANHSAIKQRLKTGLDGLQSRMRTRMLASAPHVTETTLQTAIELASNTLVAFSARAKSGASKAELQDMGRRSAQAIVSLLDADPL